MVRLTDEQFDRLMSRHQKLLKLKADSKGKAKSKRKSRKPKEPEYACPDCGVSWDTAIGQVSNEKGRWFACNCVPRWIHRQVNGGVWVKTEFRWAARE